MSASPGMFGDIAASAAYQALQGLWAQQQAVANNVANVNTPGYKAQQVSFEPSLAAAISNGDPAAMQVSTTSSTAPADQTGNNVNLTSQIVTEQKAAMQYQTMVDALNAKFQLLSVAIMGPSAG